MAVIGSATQLFAEPNSGQKTMLVRLINVTTGDTIDVSSVGPVTFHVVQAAWFVGHVKGAGAIPTITGTNLTLTLSGLANDCVDLLVMGA